MGGHWRLSIPMSAASGGGRFTTQQHCIESEWIGPQTPIPRRCRRLACWLHDHPPSFLAKVGGPFCVRTASWCVQPGPWHGHGRGSPGGTRLQSAGAGGQAWSHSLVRRKPTPFPAFVLRWKIPGPGILFSITTAPEQLSQSMFSIPWSPDAVCRALIPGSSDPGGWVTGNRGR